MTTYPYLEKGHFLLLLTLLALFLGRAEACSCPAGQMPTHCDYRVYKPAGWYCNNAHAVYYPQLQNEGDLDTSFECNMRCYAEHGSQNKYSLHRYPSNYNMCACFQTECTAYSGNSDTVTYPLYEHYATTCYDCTPAGGYPNHYSDGTFSCKAKTVSSCDAGFGFVDGGITAENSCSACGTGFFQPNDGSTNVCTAWTYSSCSANQIFTTGSASTDSTCTAKTVLSCPSGQGFTDGGAIADNSCGICPAGTAKLGDNTDACEACPVGTFSADGADACTPWKTCDSGEFFTTGSATADATCSICPAGTAKLGDNTDACEACPVGTFSPANASQCTLWLTKSCPAGQQITDQGREADASCEPCPTGTYKQGTNADQCIACPAGSEVTPVDSSSGATGCQLCQRASHYDSTGTSVVGCQTFSGCPKGHHMIITPPDQNNLCHACPAGTFQGDENSTATSCSDCFPFFFSLGGADSCTILKSECPAGFQISSIEEGIKTTHDRECERCPEGTFKYSIGYQSCAAHDATVSCPAGEEARGTTSTDATCQACPSGHFKASAGTEKCAAHKAPCDQITQTETTTPNATEDRVCSNNYNQAETTACCAEWQDAEGICQFYTTECAPGFELNDDGGVANDKSCTACPDLFNEVTSGTPDQSVDATECANQGTFAASSNFANSFPAGCSKHSSGTYYHNKYTASTKDCSVSNPCIEKSFTFKAGTNADACTGHRTTCPEATELNLNGNSSTNHACDPCEAEEAKAGTNADQCATCGAGTWTPDNIQCVAHTVCDATTEVQLAAGTTSSDTVCGCAENYHSDESACQACGAGETRLAGDSKLTSSACCSVAYQNASTEVCTPYSEDADSCNALRKPFVDGDASTDASCAAACNGTTEYASGASCVAYTTTCPAGQELSTTLTPAVDKFCSNCPQGTFKGNDGAEACATCTQGFEIIPLDATEAGTDCIICDKLIEYDADGSHTRCQVTEQHCDAGSYFTLTEKEHANTCTPCDEGEFQPLNATTNACQAWTVCLNTEVEVLSPTKKRDRVCACKQDHKFSAPDHASVVQVDFGSSGVDHYVINGDNDPDIHLCKDTDIVLNRISSGHPFRIISEAECNGRGCDAGSWTGSIAPAAIAGFTDIQGNQNATVNLAAGVYYYLCTAHRNMVGKIIVGSCDASCNSCASGTRDSGDSKLGPETTCCVNAYQKDGSHLCTPATDCLATEVQQSALGRTFDRKCMCAENHRFDGTHCQPCGAATQCTKNEAAIWHDEVVNGAADAGACLATLDCTIKAATQNGCIAPYEDGGVLQATTSCCKISAGTRLEGDDKEAAATSCCTQAFQSAAKATCTPFITTCADNKELTGGTASAQKVCADCPITKISTNGDACQTFAQKHYRSSNKPTTKTGIENAFTTAKSSFRSSSVKKQRLDFRSMIQLMKTEIASLTKRRIKLEKSNMVISTKFAASLGSRTDVEVVVPKTKTPAKLNDPATACTESDVDLNNQLEAYEVSLEEGEVSLICATNTPRTKLLFEQDSNNHASITEDVYKYSCWNGSTWGPEVQVTVGDDYVCGDNKYYVNSHSGVTCTTSAPVSSLDANVVAGTDNCGTVGEGHECTDYACNANFVLQTPPTCSADTYTPAVCHCPGNFYEDGQGNCPPHSTEPELGCNAQRKPYAPGTDTTDAQCGAECLTTQYASGENCPSYTETAVTCNAVRKTFLAGGNDFDATCPTLCLDTQYAEAGSCHDLLVNCADGFEIGGGSNSTNKVCTACPEGEYKHGTNADSCQPCGEGYEIIPLGATTEASNCEVCEVSEYDHDNSALTGCLTTNTTCDMGHQIFVTSNLEQNLCIPCEAGKFQPDDNTTAQCTAHTVTDCPDGQELTTAPNSDVDGVCTACGANKFKIGTNTNQCEDHSTCPISEGLVTLGTPSADTVCQACTGTTFSKTDDKTACVEHATCPIGSGLLTAGTNQTDTVCGPCTGTTFSGTDDKTACAEHATCPVGEGLLTSGNATHDTLCGACPSGFFSNADDKTACVQHATCDIGDGVKDFPTASADTVCEPCVAGSNFSVADDITACSTCTASCQTGFRVQTQCTVSQDIVCEPDDCPTMPDHIQVANAAGPGSCTGILSPNQTCTLLCDDWYYPAEYTCQTGVMEPPATSCLAAISECDKGQELIVVDPISDNFCQNCPAGTFQSLDNTRDACQNFTIKAMDCNALRKPFVAGDSETDASCGAACDAATQYASGAVCVPYTETAQSCNSLRKPFVAGDASTDAFCGAAGSSTFTLVTTTAGWDVTNAKIMDTEQACQDIATDPTLLSAVQTAFPAFSHATLSYHHAMLGASYCASYPKGCFVRLSNGKMYFHDGLASQANGGGACSNTNFASDPLITSNYLPILLPEGTCEAATQYASGANCVNYTETAQSCNALRKPFIAGDEDTDASCAAACALTHYASGDACVAYYTTAPAGSELILNGNEFTQHEQRACAIGTYKALSDDSACLVCEDGYEVFPIGSQSGATGCQICDVKTEFDADLLAHTGCLDTHEHCLAGFQHIETNSTSPNICEYCPAGTFQPTNDTLDQCQPYATTAADCNVVRKKLESAGASKVEDDSRCAESEVCDADHYASGFDCLPYANTDASCNAVRKVLIHGTANDQDNSACNETCSSLHYANGAQCTLYANTAASCNLEKIPLLTIGSDNSTDNSACAATQCAFEEHASDDECVANLNTEASCLGGTTRIKGTEFLVSNHQTSSQNKPVLAALEGGGLIVVWVSDNQDTDEEGIFGRLYDNQGTAIAAEFQINSNTPDEQSNPAVAALSDGSFVVVWRSNNQDSGSWGVYQQRYDAVGNKLGGEELVNTEENLAQEHPKVAAIDGIYVVVWQSINDQYDLNIFLQRYDNAGTLLGTEKIVNKHETGPQIRSNVVFLKDNKFVVLWEGRGVGDDWGIFAKIYNSSAGVVKEDFLVNKLTANKQEFVDATAIEDGFVVAWKDESNVLYARAFDNSFEARADGFLIDSSSNRQEAVSLEAIPDGGFIAVWQQEDPSTITDDIMAKRFTKALAAQADAFMVNKYTTNQQKMPSLALLSNNQLFVAWESKGQDTTSYESIYARQYTIEEANSRVIYSTHNNSDNSDCQVCLHDSEFAEKDQCKCAEDHYFTGEACTACASGTRLAGDSKDAATQCCVGGYQSAIAAVCTAYSVDAQSCNALRRPLIEGTASVDASCGALCDEATKFAQGAQCVDFIDFCLVGFELNGGTNNTQKTCQACQTGHYKSINGSSACLPHTTCLATEIQTLAPSTENDRICGCAENHYFDATCQPCAGAATRLAGDPKTSTTQCCTGGFQNTTGAVCTTYTETTDTCNPLRQPLIAGTPSQDSQCGAACNITEYAHLTDCKSFATSCPAGEQLFQFSNGQDKICVKCPIGLFKTTDDGTACQVCQDGYEVVPINAQEGGEDCIICNKSTEFDHDKLSHTGCRTTTSVCDKQFQLIITNETQSNLCESCPAEHYQDLDNTTEQCKPWVVCDINQTEVENVSPSLGRNRVCGCELDHYFNDTDGCQACAQGTRLAGDPKTEASECCVHGYQSAVGAVCTPYTFNTTYCNALRKVLPEGLRNADNACAQTCNATTEFAQGTQCIPYITSCGNGTYLGQENTPDAQKQCLPCPPGTYKDFDGAGTCIPCAAGSEVNQANDTCVPCNNQTHYDHDNTSATNCAQAVAHCDKGTELKITDALTDNRCDACPANQFQDQNASTNKCQPFTINATHCNVLNRKLVAGSAQSDHNCSNDQCLAGEDAVGEKCLCKDNHRLFNGVCIPCADGFFRDKGDDKLVTTVNTTCEESGCSVFPALSSVLYAIGVGNCNGTLRHEHQCRFECAGGHQRMPLTCNEGTLKVPSSICSRCPRYQHSNEQSVCVDDTAYLACNCTSATCPESGDTYFSIGRHDRDDSECRQPTWVEEQIGQEVERPTTDYEIKQVFQNMAAVFEAPVQAGNTTQPASKEEQREQFQSIIQYVKDEIEAMPNRRIEIPKEVMVLSDEFLQGLGDREKVELVIPKAKTPAKIQDPASACEEKDVDLAAQEAAYDVSLGEGDISLLCRGDDPVTKLEKLTNGFEYACFENGAWLGTESIDHDGSYECAGKKFYVNSHSGLTCPVTRPVSIVNELIVTGRNLDCGLTLAEGETCQTECNANYEKVSEANCTAEGFQPATCKCDKEGFSEDHFGNCKECDIGSFSAGAGQACLPWTVGAEDCNAIRKVFQVGNATMDAQCGEVCPEGLVAEWDHCTDPDKKVHCDTLSWFYFSGACCDSFDNSPTCLHQVDRKAVPVMQSLSYIKRADRTECQEGDKIVFHDGGMVCQA